MRGYRPVDTFDETTASEYDRLAVRGDEADAVEFLAGLARGGRALELAIGTGRIALPLAARGIDVSGVDLSAPMVDRLRAKPGGSAVAVTIGDFVDAPLGGEFTLVYVVFNSFFNVLTQDDQVRAFENVASSLGPDGVFVIEGFVPTFLHRLRANQYVDAEAVEVDAVRLDLLRHDPAAQTIEENHVTLSGAGARFNPVVQRYAWPHELDLMARIAGLRRRERWADWNRRPFVGDCDNCVTVYGR